MDSNQELLCTSCMVSHVYLYLTLLICWTSLVSQRVKNLPAVHENCVQSLGQEDPLKKVMATQFSILSWRESLVGYSPWNRRESDTTSEEHFFANL